MEANILGSATSNNRWISQQQQDRIQIKVAEPDKAEIGLCNQ